MPKDNIQRAISKASGGDADNYEEIRYEGYGIGGAAFIVEAMTEAHGRHLGMVRGGASSRMRPVLQVGNSVRATWRARLDEHLPAQRK